MLALLALTCAFATAAQADPTADVIGGTNVTHGDYTTLYPFMVGVLAADQPTAQFCAGTLVAPQWVMTAAHCYAPGIGAVPRGIRIGSEDRVASATYVPVIAHFIHPQWDREFMTNDIMLLKLAAAPSPATPAVRASPIDDPPAGELATLIGWGLTSTAPDAASSRFLKRATVDVIDQTECENEWVADDSDFITDNQLCAIHYDTGDGVRQACSGDSGGPLLFGNKVVGIVSFGVVNCSAFAPNVYTRVSAYGAWIDSVIDKNLTSFSESISFGATDANAGAVDRAIEFRSDGDNAVSILGVSSSGDFAIKSNSCAGAIAPQDRCSVVVTFDPSIAGLRTGELVVNTDSEATPTKRVSLIGIGTVPTSVSAPAPTALKLSIPHKSKLRAGSLKTQFEVRFAPPQAVNSPAACTGLIKLSLNSPRLKKPVTKSGTMRWSVKGCSLTLATRLPKQTKGKKVRATVAFAGNQYAAASTLAKTIRIR